MATQFKVEYTLEDKEPVEVTADQRDVAAFECEPFGLPYDTAKLRPFTFLRYMAWSAESRRARRDHQQFMQWPEFHDACVEAREVSEEPDVDPTQPEASGETSSK